MDPRAPQAPGRHASRRQRASNGAVARRPCAARRRPVAPQRSRSEAEVQPLTETLRQRVHVRVAAAGDGPPAQASEAEHAVIVEEPDRRRRRGSRARDPERSTTARPSAGRGSAGETVPRSSARPDSDRATTRRRDLRATASRSAASVRSPRAARGTVGRRAARLGEGPPARVLEPARTRDREGHLRRLRRHAEFREEPCEQRIVAGVVDEKPRVERQAVTADRAGGPPARPSRSKTSTSCACPST